jgi:hypothetical protein
LKRYRPAVWLFPNRAKNGPLSRNEAWHIFNSAKRRAGLKKAFRLSRRVSSVRLADLKDDFLLLPGFLDDVGELGVGRRGASGNIRARQYNEK